MFVVGFEIVKKERGNSAFKPLMFYKGGNQNGFAYI